LHREFEARNHTTVVYIRKQPHGVAVFPDRHTPGISVAAIEYNLIVVCALLILLAFYEATPACKLWNMLPTSDYGRSPGVRHAGRALGLRLMHTPGMDTSSTGSDQQSRFATLYNDQSAKGSVSCRQGHGNSSCHPQSCHRAGE